MSFHSLTSKPAAWAAALLLLGAAGCGTQAKNALSVQNDLSEALRSVQVDPTDAKARYWTDQAIAIAPHDPATYFGPDTPPSPIDPRPVFSIAAVFASVGDNPALADYMTQATQKFPADERGFELLAEAQEQLGRTAAEKATAAPLVVLLNKKLQKPGTTDIESLTEALAEAYFEAGDPVSGTATCRKAIQAYPTQAGPANALAYHEATSGANLPEALTLARQAVALAQKQDASGTLGADVLVAECQDTLGWVLYRQGHYAEAEQNILQAADVLPREPTLRYHLGMVYLAQGSMEAARAELGHAVLLAQGYAAAQQALGSLPKPAPSS